MRAGPGWLGTDRSSHHLIKMDESSPPSAGVRVRGSGLGLGAWAADAHLTSAAAAAEPDPKHARAWAAVAASPRSTPIPRSIPKSNPDRRPPSSQASWRAVVKTTKKEAPWGNGLTRSLGGEEATRSEQRTGARSKAGRNVRSKQDTFSPPLDSAPLRLVGSVGRIRSTIDRSVQRSTLVLGYGSWHGIVLAESSFEKSVAAERLHHEGSRFPPLC